MLMWIKRLLWVWSWIVALPVMVIAQVTIKDSVNERIFMPYELNYFVDRSNAIPFEKIRAQTFSSKFHRNREYQNTDFENGVSYWIKFEIKPNPSTKKIWLLEFYDQTIDSLDAYIPQPDGTFTTLKLGDNRPFTQRYLRHKNFEIPLSMDERVVQPYYFKVRSHEFADVRIALRSVDRFVYYALNEYYLYGMFYGMILIITLYNFMVFLAIREIKYLYYIFYILSVALYAMSYDGVGFQFLWSNYPAINDWATGISLYLVIISAVIFTRRFLSTRAHAPLVDRALKWMVVIRSIWFLFSLVLQPRLLTFRALDILPLSLIFWAAITTWRRGYRPARFFVIAYGILFFGFFVRTLVYFNFIPITIVSHYSLHLSFVLEMLFLTVALGDRVRILKDNRDRAMRRIIQQQRTNMTLKDKVNRELEEKVKERTQEIDAKNALLTESNERMALQAQEISQINSMLDLDNWKLKNRVKEVLEEHMHDKRMDFGEFLTLYPDTLSCNRFLDELKSQQEFHCQKCGNQKCSPGAQKFSRRCTRCGYNESITTNTIFQGVKFPLEKAFYLCYVTVTGHRDTTLNQLAEELDLRMNTVWAFKKKIKQQLEGVGKKGHPIRQWEEIVLYAHEPKPHRESKVHA